VRIWCGFGAGLATHFFGGVERWIKKWGTLSPLFRNGRRDRVWNPMLNSLKNFGDETTHSGKLHPCWPRNVSFM
jgi:hypothetical protein